MHLCVKNDVRQMPKRRASDTEHGARTQDPEHVTRTGAGHVAGQPLRGGNCEHIIIAIIIFLPLFALLITWRVDKANKIELA